MRVDSTFMMPGDSAHNVHDQSMPAEQADDADDLSEVSDLEAHLNLSVQLQMAAMLSFVYIWSLGAFVPFSELNSFSEFAHDQIMQLPYMVSLPEEGSVFDYYLDMKQYQFVPWNERGRDTATRAVRSSGYISLTEMERFAYIVDLYLSYGLDVMILGQEGTGKTSFVENLIHSRLPILKLQISPTLSPAQLQEFILDRIQQLDKRSGHRLVGGANKHATITRSTFFLDDIHLAYGASQNVDSKRMGEECASSPVLELARFAVQQHQLVDLSRGYTHSLNNLRYITSCTPSDYWKLPHQFSRCFNPVPFLPPSDSCLHQIFSHSVLHWLQQFPDTATGGDSEPLAKALSAASVAVYRSVSTKFHPSPSYPHLLFTMHDLLRVYEGLLLLSPNTKAQTHPQFGLLNRRGFLSSTQSGKTPQKKSNTKQRSGRRGSTVLPSLKRTGSQGLMKTMRRPTISHGLGGDETEVVTTTRMVIRLWCHESSRVYLDRTSDSRDRMWFLKLLEACVKYSFCGIDFSDPLKASPEKDQRGTQGGGRRVRGGRTRFMQGSSPSSTVGGPSLHELVSSGIKVDTLKQLMAKDREDGAEGIEGAPIKLIALEQVTLRGEDLTSLIFALFPSKTNISLKEETSTTSTKEGEETSEAEIADQATGARSYSELGDGQVMEILAKHLTGCGDEWQRTDVNNFTSQTMDLVLFKGAIEHAARLCRSMSLPGSHSLLIGAKGSGRRSLIRLMARVFNAKLFFLKESGHGLSVNESLRQQLRNVCMSAAIDGRPTVLVISSSVDIQGREWEDIYKLMNEGLYPGLFTSSELLVMSSKMQAGRLKKTVEGAQQVFARAVCRQLHVFILWDVADGKSGSLFSQSMASQPSLESGLLSEESSRLCFSSLYRACSYVDYYQPWSKQDYCDIALRWWQRFNGGSSVKWQEWVDTSSQLEAVGHLAAHVHITTIELLNRCHGGNVGNLVSPRTFIECLKMTKCLAVTIKQKGKEDAEKFKRALDKLNAIDNTVEALESQLAALQPRLSMAEQEVHEKMSLITAAKERYMAANERCKSAEQTIQRETRNMEQLSKAVDEKFKEVSPVYHSALEALISVQKNDILELMSYREPPDKLKPVFDALCMLFDRDKTWEDCKQLLLTPNFFESLKFFDRDHMPVSKLRRLEKMIDRNSKFEDMGQGSRAIVPLCMWLIALVDYHYTKMAIQPYKDRLVEAEETLMEANRIFVEMKKDMMETRTALESTVKLHKESVQKQRAIESEITGVRSKLEDAKHLLTTISAHRERWNANLNLIQSRIDSVPGHALLCSASVCYLTRTPPDRHQELLTIWLGYCSGAVSLGSLTVEQGGLQASQGHQSYSSQQQVIKIQRDFSLSSHLSEKDERSCWMQESVFPDKISLERCLAARSACISGDAQWPCIFDPHQQYEKYLLALYVKTSSANAGSKEIILPATESAISVKCQSALSHHTAMLKMQIFEPSLRRKLESSLQDGNTVLLCMDADHSHQDRQPLTRQEMAFISKVLQRQFVEDANSHGQIRTVESPHGQITVHSDFQLYLISNKRLEDALVQGLASFCVYGCELSDFCIIDGSLSLEGMESHLQRFIIIHEKPEYKIRYKSILTDLVLLQQQLMDSQEKLLNSVLDSKDPLAQTAQLLNNINESELSELGALEQISDTKKSLKMFEQQALAYKSLAELASISLTAVEKLSYTLKYFTFGIRKLEKLIVKLISIRGGNKVWDNPMSIHDNVLYLKQQLLISVHRNLQVYMFRRHQILFPLMVAFELQRRQGKVTPQECELLSSDLAGLEAQLDFFKSQVDSTQENEVPVWISRKTWCQVLQLERQVQTFQKLSSEITGISYEWKEYFDAPPYLLGYVPVYLDACTLGQKLLLWKTFKPEKLSRVCVDFIVIVIGPEVVLPQSFSVDSLLPHTSPQAPTLCVLPPSLTDGACYNESLNKPLTLLQSSASKLNRRFCSFTLFDKEHSDEFLAELTQLATEDNWVVLEHCHLFSSWQDVLKQISQVLCESSGEEDKLHPDFRLWLLLPFNTVDALSSTYGCLKVAFNCDGDGDGDKGDPKLTTLQSLSLLEDLQLIYPSQPSPTHSRWESYESFLSKLQYFLPSPLTYSQLVELDPREDTTQHLLAVLYEELCVHNSALVGLQASLNELLTFLKGDTLFTTRIGLTLTSIKDNTIPAMWKGLLPFPLAQCPELVLALNLLKSHVSFYTRVLESGKVSLPVVLEPTLFSNPRDVISRVLQLSRSGFQPDMQIDAKLLLGELSHHHDVDAVKSVVFPNVHLHGARWDQQAMQLRPLCDGDNDKRSTKGSIIVTLNTNSEERTTAVNTYNCPLLLVTSEEPTVRSAPVLCHIPLPCTSDCAETLTLETACMSKTSVDVSDYPAKFLSCEWPT